jgi:GNAT superfamily N-acetyltransferase
VSVRRLRQDELSGARDSMVAGFEADPLYRWLYPDDLSRPGMLGDVVDLVLEAALGTGSAWVLDDLLAVAALTEHGVDLIDATTEASYRRLLEQQIGRRRAAEAFAGMSACAAFAPSGAHDTLHTLAVQGSRQGEGLGTALLQSLLAQCDERGHAVHLDSSNVRNVSFYERLGFVGAGQVEVPGGGPVIRTMVRPARDGRARAQASSRSCS